MSVKLVWFGMPTCPHCQSFKKHLEETGTEHTLYCTKDKEGEAMAQKWGITNFPTLFFLDENNTVIDARVGFDPNGQSIIEVLAEYENRDR